MLVSIGPSAERLATECMSFEMTNEKVLSDKGAIALIAAEDTGLVVVELVTKEMVRSRVALCAARLVTCVPHLRRGGDGLFTSHGRSDKETASVRRWCNGGRRRLVSRRDGIRVLLLLYPLYRWA